MGKEEIIKKMNDILKYLKNLKNDDEENNPKNNNIFQVKYLFQVLSKLESGFWQQKGDLFLTPDDAIRYGQSYIQHMYPHVNADEQDWKVGRVLKVHIYLDPVAEITHLAGRDHLVDLGK
jgi:hypothetical protein